MSKEKNQNNEDKFRAIDLFAGIGGIRLGFQQAFKDEIKFVYSNEIDENCCITYEANFGENPNGDITQVDPKKIPDFDILLGGFPCQAFSIAGGKRGFDDTRGTLFFYIAEILRHKQPKAFLLENVKHLKHHDKGRTLQVIKDVLTNDLGYHIHIKILNALDFGLAQGRERIFIIGFKNNFKFTFPLPNKDKVVLEDILEPWGTVDEKFYLSHQYLTGLKKHRARHEKKGNGFGYEIRDRQSHANTIVCGGMGKERNLVFDEISKNHWRKKGDDIQLRNNEGIRKMTPLEWKRLQGFPDDFNMPVSMTRKYKQLGNSVPVPVIKSLAIEIKRSLMDKKIVKSEYLDESKTEIFQILMKMYERKNFSSTGRKKIDSLENFIKKHYLRIGNLKDLIPIMYELGIIESTSSSTIIFSNELIQKAENGSFKKYLLYLLKSEKNLSKLTNFIDGEKEMA